MQEMGTISIFSLYIDPSLICFDISMLDKFVLIVSAYFELNTCAPMTLVNQDFLLLYHIQLMRLMARRISKLRVRHWFDPRCTLLQEFFHSIIKEGKRTHNSPKKGVTLLS